MAVPGRVNCPRLEWLAPGCAECPRPGTLVATTHPAHDAGRAFQATGWKGTLKTVVQRPSP